MAPVYVQTCDLATWCDVPSISYKEIDSYYVQFVKSAKNKEFIIHLDASATFYSLHELNEILKKELTHVQVTIVFWKHLSILFSFYSCCFQIRVISINHLGNFSQLKALGKCKEQRQQMTSDLVINFLMLLHACRMESTRM